MGLATNHHHDHDHDHAGDHDACNPMDGTTQ